MQKFIKYISVVAGLLLIAGCSKSVLKEDAPNILVADNL